MVMATRPILVAKALQDARLPAFEAMQPARIYDELAAKMRRPAKVPLPTKRERHRANRFAAKMWASLIYDPVTGTASLPNPIPLDIPSSELPIIDQED